MTVGPVAKRVREPSARLSAKRVSGWTPLFRSHMTGEESDALTKAAGTSSGPKERTLQIGIMLQGFKVLTVDHEFVLDARIFFTWNALPDDDPTWEPEWNIFNQQREVNIIDKSEPSGKPEERKMNVRVQVGCSCAVDLRRFPFDVQRLECVVRIPRVHKQLISVVRADPKRSGGPRSLQSGSSWVAGINEFELAAVEAHVEYSEPGAANFKPEYRIALSLIRMPNTYLVQVAVPMYLITLFSFASFQIEAADGFESRFNQLLTIILTIVAFKFVVTQKLPTLPYQTDLDWFSNILFLFLSLVVLYNMLLPCAADSVDAIDRIGLRIFCLLFVMVSLGVLAGIWSSVRARREFAEECRKIQSVHDGAPGEPMDTKGMAGRRKSAVETLLAVQRQQSTHLQDIYREPSGGDTDGVSTGGATLYSRLESPKRETRDDLFGA